MGWESLVLRAGSPTSPRLQVHTLTEEWWFTDSNIYSNNSPSPNERWRNWWKHLLLIWRLITHKSETLTIFSIMYRVYVMKTMNWVFFIVSNDNEMFSNNTFVKYSCRTVDLREIWVDEPWNYSCVHVTGVYLLRTVLDLSN